MYYLKGDGSWNAHHVYRMFNSHLSYTQTISVYLQQHTVVWAQLATSTAFNVFANLNLSNGTLCTRGLGRIIFIHHAGSQRVVPVRNEFLYV